MPNLTDIIKANKYELERSDSTALVAGVVASDMAKRSTAGYRTIEEFGGGVDVEDNTEAWQLLLASGTKWIHFGGNGGYKFLSSSTHNSDIVLTFSNGAYIDCTDAGFVGNFWTKFSGSISALPELSMSVNKGAYSLTFTSTPDLQAGDVFFIFNPTPSSWSLFRTVYFAGEICEVAAVSGSTVRLVNPLYDSYTADNVDVHKMNPIRVLISDIDIRGDKSTSLIDIEFGRHCYVKSPSARHKNNSVVQFIRSYNCAFDKVDIFNEGTGIGDDYGIVITNSQTIKGFGGKAHSRRHPITTGGDGEVCAVPCRDLLFDSITLSNDPNSGVFSADFHGNTESSKYANCKIYGGATWQGKDNGYENCEIYAMSNGTIIYAAELVGGTLYARGCKLYSYVDPSSSTRGCIDVGGNSITALNSSTTEDVTLSLTGCTLNGENFSDITSIMTVVNRGSLKKLNVNIDDLTLNVNNMGQILYTSLESGTADSDYIAITNVKSNVSTQKLLCNHQSSAYTGFPHKLQTQTGRQTIATTTSAPAIIGVNQGFKWAYPRLPSAGVTAVNQGFIGSKLPQAYIDTGMLTVGGIRTGLATPDATNFSSETSVDVCWTTSIDEI